MAVDRVRVRQNRLLPANRQLEDADPSIPSQPFFALAGRRSSCLVQRPPATPALACSVDLLPWTAVVPSRPRLGFPLRLE